MRFTFFLKNCFETKEQRPRVDVKSTATATKLCHNEISCRFLFALLNSINKQNEWNYWKHKAETIHSTNILRLVRANLIFNRKMTDLLGCQILFGFALNQLFVFEEKNQSTDDWCALLLCFEMIWRFWKLYISKSTDLSLSVFDGSNKVLVQKYVNRQK